MDKSKTIVNVDKFGDYVITIPDEVMEELGWTEPDEVKIEITEFGDAPIDEPEFGIVISKVK